MLNHTLSFFFLLFGYIIFSSIIFHFVFYKDAPELYGTMYLSLRSMMDIIVGNYEYRDFDDKETIHSCLLILCIILGSVILINYLVGIMTTAYWFLVQ